MPRILYPIALYSVGCRGTHVTPAPCRRFFNHHYDAEATTAAISTATFVWSRIGAVITRRACFAVYNITTARPDDHHDDCIQSYSCLETSTTRRRPPLLLHRRQLQSAPSPPATWQLKPSVVDDVSRFFERLIAASGIVPVQLLWLRRALFIVRGVTALSSVS